MSDLLTREQILCGIQKFHDEMQAFNEVLLEEKQKVDRQLSLSSNGESSDILQESELLNAQSSAIEALIELHCDIFDEILCRKGL